MCRREGTWQCIRLWMDQFDHVKRHACWSPNAKRTTYVTPCYRSAFLHGSLDFIDHIHTGISLIIGVQLYIMTNRFTANYLILVIVLWNVHGVIFFDLFILFFVFLWWMQENNAPGTIVCIYKIAMQCILPNNTLQWLQQNLVALM